MRRLPVAMFIFALSIGGVSGAERRRPPAKHSKLHEYRRSVFTKRAVAGAGVSAAIGTARNRPHEWGGGPLGFAKRAGSSFGTHVVKGSIEFGVAAARHENLHYQRSNKHGTMPRLGYAVKSTFIVPKTNQRGKKTLATSRIAGNLGAGLISRAWQPASSAGVGAGLASGGIGLGADVGANVAREFWPRKKHARRVAHARSTHLRRGSG